MTFLISMLFIAAIAFSLMAISGSFASSWSRMVEIIELENSNIASAPKIRVGEAIFYKSSNIKSDTKDAVIIAFPHKSFETSLEDDIFIPEAA